MASRDAGSWKPRLSPKMHLLSIAGLLLCALPSLGSAAQPFVARQAPEETNATAAVPRSYIIEYAAVSYPNTFLIHTESIENKY